MTIPTTMLIIIGGLMMYYSGMIAYDLYIDKLKEVNSEEDNEVAVDITGQMNDFKAIPVNKQDGDDEKRNRFENLLRAGITAEKANRMMKSIADGSPAKELEDVMYIIRQHQTSTIIQ